MTELLGRCLCGSVVYSVSGPLLRTGHCHCESCRRAASSPVTTFFCVATGDVRFSGTPPRLFQSSPGVTRGFCGDCGSPMTFETDRRPGEIDLYVASLEDAGGLEITQHWHWNERVSWLRCEDDLPKRSE